MSMDEGYMIVNGKKVEGRTLSLDSEGLKVGQDGEERVVVPNEFDFAESAEVDESDFADWEGPVGELKTSYIDKKCIMTVGAILGVCVGIVISGVILHRKRH